jgi:glycosyltransferase involved in cell wall biosynthesis
MKKIKVCWLASYPIDLLLPELQITQNFPIDSTMWLVSLSEVIARNNEIELHIITHAAKIPYDQYIFKNNIHFHVLRYSFIKDKGYPSYFPINVISWYFLIVKKILKKIEEIKPDIVHAHGTEGFFSLAALKSKLPNITSIQGIISEYVKLNFSLLAFFQQRIEKYCIRKNKNFGCRTNWDNSFVKSINKDAQLFYAPEALSYAFFDVKWQGIKNINKLIFVGNLVKRKRIELLIDAVHKLIKLNKDINVVIIGGGSPKYIESIKKKMNELKIEDRFEFKGFMKSEQIAKELSGAGIYVHTANMDNSPNSLCEAMAIGMPTVASNVGGIPSIIDNEKTGLLFELDDVDDLCLKINKFLNNHEYAKTIAKNASIEAFNRNYPDKVAKIILDIYIKIINGLTNN